MKRAFAQRQIPTLLGIGILIAALVGGIALIGEGGGVFAPRATPQTTPKNIKITNIKDTSFTVSFLTDEATAGFIKYGESAEDLKKQASDDRDQLTGSVSPYTSHYITVRDLEPGTEYFFTLGTASVPKTDNNGTPFTVKTAPKGGNPTAAKTAYGTINTASGGAADGAVVYMTIPGASELSALVKASGSWAIPLSNARTADLSGYVSLEASTPVSIFVQGASLSESASTQLTIGETQPVPTLVLAPGNGSAPIVPEDTNIQADLGTGQFSLTDLSQETTAPFETPPSLLDTTTTASPEPTVEPTAEPTIVPSPTTQQADTVDMTVQGTQTVDSQKPTITGKAAPNTVITIQVNSDTQIVTQVKTDENGHFTLPLSGGETQLEPGEHTVTITYTDPVTGEEKTEIKTFFVADESGSGRGGDPEGTLLAQANTSPSPVPFGSENPYTIPTPTPSPSPSASPSPSPRVAMPATTSAVPKSGSVSTTFGLIFGGLLMIGIGVWTYHHNTTQALLDSELELDSEESAA